VKYFRGLWKTPVLSSSLLPILRFSHVLCLLPCSSFCCYSYNLLSPLAHVWQPDMAIGSKIFCSEVT
jgi:hypothetical protein